jgi:hypothetical protein
MRSATAGFEGVVEALLRAKCAVDLRMRTGDSPLHLASGARTGRCCATSLKLKVSGQGLGLGIARRPLRASRSIGAQYAQPGGSCPTDPEASVDTANALPLAQ